MRGCTIQVIDSPDALSNFREEWDDLIAASHGNTIFQTWEWTTAWVREYLRPVRRLFVLVVRKRGAVLCIAPWYVRDVRYGPFLLKRVEFLGTPEAGSDYLDVISRSGKEQDAAHCLYDYLMEEAGGEWDCLLFRDVSSSSIFLNHFCDRFEADGKYVRISRGSYCPTVKLPESNERFLASLRPHRRSQFNRHWRMIRKEEGIQYGISRDPLRNGYFREFLEFYEKQWGRSGKRHFQFMESFISLASNKGWVEVEYLRYKGRYVAAILHITHDGTKYSYLTAVDKTFNRKVSIGNVLVCLALQDAIERQVGTYNFLKGVEPYKYHWANSGDQLLDFSYQKRRIVSTMQFLENTLKNAGKILLR